MDEFRAMQKGLSDFKAIVADRKLIIVEIERGVLDGDIEGARAVEDLPGREEADAGSGIFFVQAYDGSDSEWPGGPKGPNCP